MITRINYRSLIVSALLATSLFLSGCISKPYIVKPNDGYVGNISIQSITVSKTTGVNSDTVVAAVKSQLQSDVTDLHGNKKVDMKVKLDYLTVPLPGGDITGKLLGSTTSLKGTVSILDNEMVVAKYKISADYSEGGLLGSTTTVSFVDATEEVVKKFSEFTINYMQ